MSVDCTMTNKLQYIKSLQCPRPNLELSKDDMVRHLKNDYQNPKIHTDEKPCFLIPSVSPHFVRHLGYFLITKDDYAASDISILYSWVEKSKSRRREAKYSLHWLWNKYQDEIIETANLAYKYYCSPDAILMEQPLSIVENECFLQLKELQGPSFFPISIAVSLINHFKAKRVLDLSAGWGDRLIAACVTGCDYWSCDPNPDLAPVYDSIIKDLGHSSKQSVTCGAFEDPINRPPHHILPFDFLLTSPPFFDLELYGQDNKRDQSVERYPKLGDWLHLFLFASLKKADVYLQQNAYICIHLTDVLGNLSSSYQRRQQQHIHSIDEKNNNQYDSTSDKVVLLDEIIRNKQRWRNIMYPTDLSDQPHIFIVDKLIRFCIENLRWKYIGTLAYAQCHSERGIKRHRKTNKILGQPLWIFQKPCSSHLTVDRKKRKVGYHYE